MIRRDKIIRELLQDDNLYLPFVRELEKRDFDYSFASLLLQVPKCDLSKVYPYFSENFVTWEISMVVPSSIMINHNGHISDITKFFVEDLIKSVSSLYIHNSNIQSIGGYRSWFIENFLSIRDSYVKLWDLNIARKGYCLAGDCELEIVNTKPAIAAHSLEFSIVRSNNTLNLSSSVPVEPKSFKIRVDFRSDYVKDSKVKIDMENFKGWGLEINFNRHCEGNEVKIVNVEDERYVEVNYIGEASVKVNNVVMINGKRKL